MADQTISRRTILKGLGLALGAGALPPSARAERGESEHEDGEHRKHPATRCYLYVSHSGRRQWVLSALLTGDPARPRQILHRVKRHKLPKESRSLPLIEARNTSSELRRYLYRQLALEKGFRKGRNLGFEVYGIHADRAFLDRFGARKGQAQLAMLVALIDGCRLSRFREVFVYYNVPALRGVPKKLLHAAILDGVERHKDATLKIWSQRAVHRVALRPTVGDAPAILAATGGEDGKPVVRTLAADSLQITQFVTDAFFRKHEYGDDQGLRQIRRLVRADVDARFLPAVLKLSKRGRG